MNRPYDRACRPRRVGTATAFMLLVVAVFAGLAGCSESPETGEAKTGNFLLVYEEQEPGTEVYPVRVLITPDYLRFDDGADDGDYLLLDRSTRTAYSVAHEESSILVLDVPVSGKRPSGEITLEEKRTPDPDAPLVAGTRPLTVEYLADGERCMQAVVVPGFLSGAADALAEYARLLGDRQYRDLDTVPADMRTGCFLARYIYHTDRHLAEGLPLQEWDDAGYRRSLVGFEENAVFPDGLFSLPDGYGEIRLDGPG